MKLQDAEHWSLTTNHRYRRGKGEANRDLHTLLRPECIDFDR